MMMADRGLQWIEIDTGALSNNLALFRRLVSPETEIAVVVKANAYGHGLSQVVGAIGDQVDWLATHSADEARQVRQLGFRGPILLMGYLPPSEARDLDPDMHVFVSTEEVLETLAEYRARTDIAIPVHLKIDTGTHRQGCSPEESMVLLESAKQRGLEVVGLATHFANIEDTLEHDFARRQIREFETCLNAVERTMGTRPRWVHTACSAAALLFRETDFSLVRIGISAYGHWSSRETHLAWKLEGEPGHIQLRPALSWATVVGQMQRVKKGETVGYGRTWTALRDTILAVLPVGYSDGYPRALGNQSRVIIRGTAAPIVGRVCMNIMMADVTDIPGVTVGDEVVLLGRSGDVEVSAEELAGLAGTINYEFLARLSPLIPRTCRDGR